MHGPHVTKNRLVSRSIVSRAGRVRPEKRHSSRPGVECEMLEGRTFFSFVYEDFGALTSINDPHEFGAGTTNRFFGPIAILDDIDHDGVRDVLIGNTGTETVGRTGTYLRGAAVFSGATGALLRTHDEPGAADDRYGWQVANVGDVDDDGVADYGISHGGYLYSGATGTLIRRYGGTIAGAGDVNRDGVDDLLVGDPDNQRVSVYSGISDDILREFLPTPIAGGSGFGDRLYGGVDLDSDGVPDAVVESSVPSGTPGYPVPHLWAFSGATGAVLWDRGSPGNSSYSFRYEPTANVLPDLTGDAVADVVVTVGDQLFILSGVDGEVARALTPVPAGGLGRFVSAYGDLDQDGSIDLALSGGDPGSGASRLLVISSATGGVLSSVGFFGATPDLGPYGFGGAFAGSVGVADLDGDGLNDLIGIYQRLGSYQLPGFARSFVFSGSQLLGTTISGVGTGPVSRSIIWGQASLHAFLARDGVVEFLSGHDQWADDEVIIDIYESDTEIVILGAASSNGRLPFVWIADHNLMNVRRVDITRPFPFGDPPNPPTIEDFGVAVAGHHVLVNQLINNTVSSVFLFDADTEVFTSVMDGTGVDLGLLPTVLGPDLIVLVGLGTDDPPMSYLWRQTRVSPVPSMSSFPGQPIALSPSGEFAISLVVGAGGSREIHRHWESPSGPTDVIVPMVEGGEDYAPAGVNNFGDVTGTYILTATGQRSGFYYASATQETFDLRSGEVLGDPFGYSSTSLTRVTAPTNTGDVLVQWAGRFALVTLADPAFADGPIRAADGATISVAFTPDGSVYVVTGNGAGETLHLARGPAGWAARDLNQSHGFGVPFRLQASTYVTWYDVGDSNPTIALVRPEGLLLLEPTGNPDVWVVRNLTEEIAGAEPIVDGLLTFLPQNGLRIVAGLNASGELMLYGQTVGTRPDGSQAWAFDNLFESLVYPTGTPPPRFREYTGTPSLVGYVTGWGGQNIAGIAGGGQIVVFWTAPGLTGWRITNLAQVLNNSDFSAASSYRSISVSLTPWNGINIYGESTQGNRIQVLWWVPQFGGLWRAETLTATNFTPTGTYPAGTLTSYSTPWGGLNVARVNPSGQIEVYWWSPASNHWTQEVLNPQTTSHLRNFHAVGRLSSAVSPQGEMNIFARNELGDIFRFVWDPQHSWRLERV